VSADPIRPLSPDEIVSLMPQEPPMWFIDRIDEVDAEHIVSRHTWTEADCDGHFRGNPIVPGVKLVELGAQGGVVAWLLYHASLERPRSQVDELMVLFTHLDTARFLRVMRPGETTICRSRFGDVGFYRRFHLRAEVRLELADGPDAGAPVLTGVFSGYGVPSAKLETLGR
jgi:3-hydroxyacyl-[acyl-carrier-protein] dehydratase